MTDFKYITLTCSDGSTIDLPENYCGCSTGYGRVVNGYLQGVEYFDKISDGDTVVECEKDDPCAIPIADAYQDLYTLFDQEQEDFNFYLESIGEKPDPIVRRGYTPKVSESLKNVFIGDGDKTLTHNPFSKLSNLISK